MPVDRLLEALPTGLRIGMLANQVSFSHTRKRYSFELIPGLQRVFLPEHGLFAELQDQIPLESVSPYRCFRDIEWVSLYGTTEDTLVPDARLLSDLDLLIFDLQDVGARYYTFLTSIYYTMQVAMTLERPPAFCIVDRPNPAGRVVEGTPLEERFASFVGVPGILHRHGLTAAELLLLYRHRLKGSRLPFVVIPFDPAVPIMDETGLFRQVTGKAGAEPFWSIPPSPNMPSPVTPLVYTGQCLLEGTNLSEGRGTTRPFEIFGAPFITDDWMMELCHREDIAQPDLCLRPLRFIPAFHKFAGRVCNGWQIMPQGSHFHSLLFTLDLIRLVKNRFEDFAWRTETYEYRDDLLAIEMLVGDRTLLDYINGKGRRADIVDYMRAEEKKWLRQAEPFLLYPERPVLVPTSSGGQQETI